MKTGYLVLVGLLLALLACSAAAESDLMAAVSSSDSAKVKQLLAGDPASAGAADELGRTPLHLAAQVGNVDIIAMLLGAGAKVDARGSYGRTPLHMATCARQVDAMKALIAAGADVNGKDNTGKTSLHWAPYEGRPWFHDETARKCYLEPAQTLIDAGADIKSADKLGNTPLHYAAWFGCKKIAALLAPKVDVNVANNEGRTPLHQAAFRGNAEVVSILLEANADKSVKDKSNRTPLDLAYSGKANKAETVKLLLER